MKQLPLKKDEVVAFLSCSVRPQDRPLVSAIHERVLRPMGFRCVTVGRNVSLPEQPDEAIRQIMSKAHCLIGVATVRLDATDRHFPDRSLSVATPYLLQEASMAFQERLPFLMFKTPDVTLQGVTGRNLYVEIGADLSSAGRPVFKSSRELVRTSLSGLKERALERKRAMGRAGLWEMVRTGSTVFAGGVLVGKLLDALNADDEYYAEFEDEDEDEDEW